MLKCLETDLRMSCGWRRGIQQNPDIPYHPVGRVEVDDGPDTSNPARLIHPAIHSPLSTKVVFNVDQLQIDVKFKGRFTFSPYLI